MSTLPAFAVTFGSLAAIVTAVKVLTGWGPFRWVWRRLVHDPVQEGLRSVVKAEVHPMLAAALTELRPNHGTSLRDAVDRLSVDVAEFKDYQHNRNHDMLNGVQVAIGRTALLEIAVAEVQRDLLKFNEIDQLGRDGRVDRRKP